MPLARSGDPSPGQPVQEGKADCGLVTGFSCAKSGMVKQSERISRQRFFFMSELKYTASGILKSSQRFFNFSCFANTLF
jgi:hypothetical protein